MVDGGDFTFNTEEYNATGTTNMEIFWHISLHCPTLDNDFFFQHFQSW